MFQASGGHDSRKVTAIRFARLTLLCVAALACTPARPKTLLGCFAPTRSAIAWQLGRGDYPAVRGRVVRIDSASPIPGASVFVGTPARSTRTGDDGSFELRVDSAGQFPIEVRRVGYERAKTTIEIPRGGAVVILAALEPRNQFVTECADGPATTTPPRER